MSDTLTLDRRAESAILDGLESVLSPDRLETYRSSVWNRQADGGAAAKVRLANSIFLGAAFRTPDVAKNPAAYRQTYANAMWGGESGDTEEAFAARARVQMQQQRDERGLLTGPDGEDDAAKQARALSMQSMLVDSALAEKPYTAAWKDWQSAAAGKPGYRQDRLSAYEQAARNVHAAISERVQRVKPAVDEIEAGLRQEQAVSGAYGGDNIVEALRKLPEEDRAIALQVLQKRLAPDGAAKEAGGQFFPAPGRGIIRIAVGNPAEYSRNRRADDGDAVKRRDSPDQFSQAFARGMASIPVGMGRTIAADQLDSAEKALAGVQPGETLDAIYSDLPAALKGDTGMSIEASLTSAPARVGGIIERLFLGPTSGSGRFFTNEGQTITQEDIDGAKAWIAGERDKLAIGMQLEQLAKGELDPIKGANWFQNKIAYPFAEYVLPQVALFALTHKISPAGAVFSGTGKLAAAGNAAVGGLGSVPLMFGMMADQNAQQLMALNPGMKVEDAFRIGRSASYVQTGLEYAQNMLGLGLLGKAKGLGQQLLKLRGSAWAKLGAGLVAGAVEQNLIEGVQDIMPPVMQALTKDAPDVPWKQFFEGPGGYWAQRGDTFWAVLPLVVFGAGGNAIRSKASAADLERVAGSMSDMQLHAAGIPAEARTAILAETDPVKRLDAFSEALPKADKAAAEEGARLLAERSGRLQKALGAAGVTISRAPDGTATVRTADGVTSHADFSQALQFSRAYMDSTDAQQAAPFWKMLDALESRAGVPIDGSETTIGTATTTAADALLAAEQAGNTELADAMRARMQVEQARMPDAPIDWSRMAFSGQSRLVVQEGLAAAVARIDRGESALTVLEERAENDVSAFIRSGETTWDQLAADIRAVEAATGDAYLAGHTGGADAAQDIMAVKEAYSLLTKVYATARGKTGGAVAEAARMERADGVKARARLREAEATGATPAVFERLRAAWEWFKALMQQAARLNKARRDGTIGNVEQFLSRSIGLDEQQSHAAAVAREAGRIFGEDPAYVAPTAEEEAGGIAFSVGRGGSGSTPAPSSGADSFSVRPNPASDSISYRLTPTATLDALSASIGNRMSRDPVARRTVMDTARGNLARLRESWTALRNTWRGDAIRPKTERRTPKELNKEQARWRALRLEELESEVERRHQGTLDAMQEGLADFDSAVHPVLSRITTRQRVKWMDKNGKERSALHIMGDILPRARAALSGMAEYDDADGLPSFLFRGTRAPDQVAQELAMEGIGDGSVSGLWQMLRKEVDSVRAMKDAVAAMATDMKNARNQAHEEAAEWRREQDEMQAEDWSGRAMLVRNLRILDAILAAFPPEVRAKVGGWTQIASLKTEKAMAAELDRRIVAADAHLEEALRKDALTEIRALFRQARPDRTPGEKPRGKLGAAAHRFFDEAQRVAGMTPEQIEAARPTAEQYAEAETPEAAADLWEREQILDQIGGLDAKVDGRPFRDAAHLVRALDMLQDVYATGRNRWRTIEEARLEGVRNLTAQTVEALGGVSRAGIQRRKAADARPLSLFSRWGIMSFTEVLEEIFGRGNPLVTRWGDAVRNGNAARTDEVLALRRRFADAGMRATGHRGRLMRRALWEMGERQRIGVSLQSRSFQDITVPIETLGGIVDGTASLEALGITAAEAADLVAQFEALPADSTRQNLTVRRETRGAVELVNFTEAEGIFLTMLWRQQQYQAALERDGFDQTAIDDIERQISDAGRSMREFMAGEYAAGYAPLATVFERMFGVALPQIENYAPGAFYNSGSSESGLDVTGSGVVEGGFRAGFLKDRKNHKAAPKAENAFATFFGHMNQTAHWKAHAETFRELRAVFGNPKVKMALESAHGAEGVRAVQDWLTALEGNGLKQAGGKLMNFLFSLQAYKALAWKVGTLAKQSSALLGAAFRMPLGDYARGLGRLFTGQLDYRRMWNSPMIRRRIDSGYSPEVRAVLAQTWSAAPTRRMDFLNRGMELIGVVDALFTTGSAAICYDYHYRQGLANGLSDAAAHLAAEREAADMIARTAQPAEVSDKSLLELRMNTNALGRIAFMFSSEARQKSSMWLGAWRNVVRGRATAEDARVLVVAHLFIGPLIQAISAAWRDARDDDDSELFDHENWNPADFLAAAVFGPMAGIPLLRDIVDGFDSPDGGPLGDYASVVRSGKNILTGPKGGQEKEPLEFYEKNLTKLMQVAPFPGAVANIADQTFRLGDNLWSDPEEARAQEDRKKRREKPGN